MKLTKILCIALTGLALGACSRNQGDDTLVIIHTNDTHSHIDPETDNDLGGVARRKVLFDSIREANANVLTVDAGDIVQGTLYFHLYKGEVEQEMINALGYDVQILGNHEFDNGMPALKKMLDKAETQLLATNYDLSKSLLSGMFEPYMTRQIGRHKVGIFALNLNPKGMVAEGNYDGVEYLPWKPVTERTVKELREKEGCDYVIALTHIGYSGSDENPELFGDVQVAQQTTGIDLIIGGHSHTLLDPAVKVANLDGDSVTIVQTGKYGRNIGEITLNLNSGKITEKIIPVDSRLDSRRDPAIMARLEPYRAGIDSLYNRTVARLDYTRPLHGRDEAMKNFAADFILERGAQLAGKPIDGAIGNKGGLRTTWNPGDISEGAAIDMMPFTNKIVVLEISGKDLRDAFDIMKARGGDAVSGITDPSQIDPKKTYRIATIDYLANGGDYMEPLTRGTRIAESRGLAYDDLLEYFAEHPVLTPDTVQRMK